MPKHIDWDRSVFLAHSSTDKPLVRDLCRKLKDHGIAPWLDEEMLEPGDEWDKEIRAAIRRSRFFLACFSRKSVGRAGYLQRELRLALSALEEKPPNITFLIPALLEDVELPDITVGTVSLRSYQYVRLFESNSLERLIDTLKVSIGLTLERAIAATVGSDEGASLLDRYRAKRHAQEKTTAPRSREEIEQDASEAMQMLQTNMESRAGFTSGLLRRVATLKGKELEEAKETARAVLASTPADRRAEFLSYLESEVRAFFHRVMKEDEEAATLLSTEARLAQAPAQPNEGSGRMTMAYAKRWLAQLGPLEDLPLARQLLAKAILESATEAEFVPRFGKLFYLLSDEDQVDVLRGALADSSEQLAPIRRLIRELPEHLQRRVLAADE